MITVLVLASSPQDQGSLHLGKEHKLIQHTLDRARNRDQFRVVSCMATTVDDLRSYLLEHSPTIVHFCGHGSGPGGLCFEEDSGNTHFVSGASLAKLFHLASGDLKCIVLNACYSEDQALPISDHIDFVVGMRDSIGDVAALKFAQGFYEAVWAGETFERSFKFGCSAIDTAGLPEEDVPKLLRSPRLGSQILPYGELTQRIENFLLRYVNSPMPQRLLMTVEGADALLAAATSYYADAVLRPAVSVSVTDLRPVTSPFTAATAVVRWPESNREHTYYVSESAGELRLDWKATVGYWEVPALTLSAIGSSVPVTIRAVAQISDLYVYNHNPSQYLSVHLSELDGARLLGYLPKVHPDFDRLLNILKDGHRHRLTLSVVLTQPGKAAEIVQLLADSWIFPSRDEDGP